MNNQPLLLVVDDEDSILKTLKDSLEDENYRVEILNNGQNLLQTIGNLIPDLIFLDIFMPNTNGLELLEKIKKEYPQQKVIIISGFGNISIAIQAMKNGAIDFIEKPLNLDDILNKINFLKNNNVDLENNKLEQKNLHKHNIIGQSYLFLELIEQAKLLAQTELPVLIYGKSGTGKSLIAEFIHEDGSTGSPRTGLFNNQNFYVLNSEFLTEQEFLENLDNFYLNNSGTILVKNINSLSSNSQKKLLYYLENNSLKINRLIATSQVNLFDLVKENKFNNSLFNKLNITPIEIPSLNKRRYDIPLLTDYFLKKFNQKYQKNITLDNKAIRLLRNHNWKTNITELKNLIEKIVVSTNNKNQIIPAQAFSIFLEENKYPVIEEQLFLKFNSLQEATNNFEKNFLIYLLKKNKFDLQQVSNRLNLTTIELRDKIDKLNINIKN